MREAIPHNEPQDAGGQSRSSALESAMNRHPLSSPKWIRSLCILD
ncbi:unnamed protein product [Urochloa humidicola]